ncbi:Hypothetical protein PHPALM_11931 [Phytophthora palmivora]|uniref:Uncharacterized protein n=1 Tax=Phytophthora palmivora TaxID=4796 RepID=A0A2P4Y116_9STRA|nr:Hypothetical protein PHPALM_11931 [Phytophthora palmivora]
MTVLVVMTSEAWVAVISETWVAVTADSAVDLVVDSMALMMLFSGGSGEVEALEDLVATVLYVVVAMS